MKLNEYLSHIKHVSLDIRLIDTFDDKIKFNGSISEYFHWIYKDEYDELNIYEISFNEIDIMCIYLGED